jgi:hypothetical protein
MFEFGARFKIAYLTSFTFGVFLYKVASVFVRLSNMPRLIKDQRVWVYTNSISYIYDLPSDRQKKVIHC